ncbi:hypothetical protein BVY04_05260 [bacterium M21]|nr:hypothetical protein BVY04_05260 [bacterium M21]
MKLPFSVDLSGQVAVVTGGGGVLCGEMAKALAACGAKVAVMDLRLENASKVTDVINASGGAALPVAADVTSREALNAAYAKICSDLGPCDILVNGAGGNHPKGTSSLESVTPTQLADTVDGSFFSMEPEGIEFVFKLNYIGTVLPTLQI